jgi:cytochrome c2
MANPTDTSYVPRPEWYFLFLFQLLKFFPGRLELVGTVILPSLAILLLAILPFLRRTHSSLFAGPLRTASVVAVAFCAWLGLTAAAAFSDHSTKQRSVTASESQWAHIPAEVIAGYGYFRDFRCESCHDLIVGPPKAGPTLGLTGIQRPRDWILEHFNAEAQGAGNGSPPPSLSAPQRNSLVVFVANVKPDLLPILPVISEELINGAQVFVASACASCHKVNGIGGESGPALNGLIGRRDEKWIRAHFIAPRKLSPGSIMPPYRFNPTDEQDLIKYLLSLPE